MVPSILRFGSAGTSLAPIVLRVLPGLSVGDLGVIKDPSGKTMSGLSSAVSSRFGAIFVSAIATILYTVTHIQCKKKV